MELTTESKQTEALQMTEQEQKMQTLQNKFNQLSMQRGVWQFQLEDLETRIEKTKEEQYNANIEYQKLYDKWQKEKLDLVQKQKEVTQ